jgi:hypothetical protein
MGVRGEKEAQTDRVGWAVQQVDAREKRHVVAVDDPRCVPVQW